jgi:hypothetical protein
MGASMGAMKSPVDRLNRMLCPVLAAFANPVEPYASDPRHFGDAGCCGTVAAARTGSCHPVGAVPPPNRHAFRRNRAKPAALARYLPKSAETVMTLLHSATLGVALALGAASAHAADVISRQIENAPVEITVTQTPTGTVITRRPLAPIVPYAGPVVETAPYAVEPVPRYPASTTVVDETVGAAPAVTTTTRTVHHATTHARRVEPARTATVRTTRRVVVAPRLVLDAAQRDVLYRTIVAQQGPPLPPPGYPPYPTAAYPATTGYAVSAPAEVDDVTVEQVPAATAVVYTVGARLPAGVVTTPLPPIASLRVPAVQPYGYVALNGHVLLVDPATNTVVADITR